MKPICQICQKTNFMPQACITAVATFSQRYLARDIVDRIEKAHIIVSFQKIVSEDMPTLILQLHGIQDIIHLQMLYVESMCKENNALTFEVFSSTKSQEKILQQFL